jgi:hypothetical protein
MARELAVCPGCGAEEPAPRLRTHVCDWWRGSITRSTSAAASSTASSTSSATT